MTLGIGTGALVAGLFGMNVRHTYILIMILPLMNTRLTAAQPSGTTPLYFLCYVMFRDKSSIGSWMGRSAKVICSNNSYKG